MVMLWGLNFCWPLNWSTVEKKKKKLTKFETRSWSNKWWYLLDDWKNTIWTASAMTEESTLSLRCAKACKIYQNNMPSSLTWQSKLRVHWCSCGVWFPGVYRWRIQFRYMRACCFSCFGQYRNLGRITTKFFMQNQQIFARMDPGSWNVITESLEFPHISIANLGIWKLLNELSWKRIPNA